MGKRARRDELPERIVMRLNLESPQDRAIAEWWVANQGKASKVGRDAIYTRVTGLDPVTGRPVLAQGFVMQPDHNAEASHIPALPAPAARDEGIEVDDHRAGMLDRLGEI